VVGRGAQGRSPDRRANPVEDQVAQRWVAGQANRYRHDRAQSVDKAEAQYPDVRVLADVLQGPIAQQLPARLAGQQFAAVLAAHVIPKLVAGVAAAKGNDHDHVDIHVAAEREEAFEDQDGLAFKEGAQEERKVAEVMQELLKHGLGCWRNERAAYSFTKIHESIEMCHEVNDSYVDDECDYRSHA